MSRYKVIWRDGSYRWFTAAELPVIDERVWAVVRSDIIGGGDAFQELARTLWLDDEL